MIMRAAAMLLFLCCCMCGTGCTWLTPEQNAAMLDKLADAWHNKGADAVAVKLAEMVAAGKITQAQADALNAAAQRGYDALMAKAEEIAQTQLEKNNN